MPILGLYLELLAMQKKRRQDEECQSGTHRASDLDSVTAFLEEVERSSETLFPPSFVRVTAQEAGAPDLEEEVMLFGDLVARARNGDTTINKHDSWPDRVPPRLSFLITHDVMAKQRSSSAPVACQVPKPVEVCSEQAISIEMV